MGSIHRDADTEAAPSLPYWQVNVPAAQRTESCPEFLAGLSSKDIGILATPDPAYHLLSWPHVRSIIAANRLDRFQRVPSQLRRYLAFIHAIKSQYGSVMAFIVSERLRWDLPICPREPLGGGKLRPSPFNSAAEDVKILWNDWPYGIDERIVHLVVWTKFELQDDPVTGDLTEQARGEIEAFVDQVFYGRVGKENFFKQEADVKRNGWLTSSVSVSYEQVIWFKNWKALKSVHAVEHFHVMLFDPPREFVEEVTGGDVPLCRNA
ncbi:hypothetical protein BP5796_07430 [Coleophoma crateriformis]|uniref:Uncharacterized protein n=1 Tax=Coleophoma crateriformis TaxID=565419 RepID=A0A3D8RJ81_9HELO|nr:hypothetical protein BP5796_07430 [Coleophoma crateriformis]